MARITIHTGKVSVEGENQKEIFEELARYQEIFEVTSCKKCKQENLRYVVREQADAKGKKHRYFEIRCSNCYAKLSFGQHVDSPTLFPKKWTRFNHDTEKEEEV